jgi:Uma2 family endonuclease
MVEGKMFDEKYEMIEKLMIQSDYFTSQNLYLTPADLLQLDEDNKHRNGELQVGGFLEMTMNLIQQGYHIFYSGDGW